MLNTALYSDMPFTSNMSMCLKVSVFLSKDMGRMRADIRYNDTRDQPYCCGMWCFFTILSIQHLYDGMFAEALLHHQKLSWISMVFIASWSNEFYTQCQALPQMNPRALMLAFRSTGACCILWTDTKIISTMQEFFLPTEGHFTF